MFKIAQFKHTRKCAQHRRHLNLMYLSDTVPQSHYVWCSCVQLLMIVVFYWCLSMAYCSLRYRVPLCLGQYFGMIPVLESRGEVLEFQSLTRGVTPEGWLQELPLLWDLEIQGPFHDFLALGSFQSGYMLNVSREICIEGRFNPASLECCCSAVTLFKPSDDREWCKIIASNLFWSFFAAMRITFVINTEILRHFCQFLIWWLSSDLVELVFWELR